MVGWLDGDVGCFGSDGLMFGGGRGSDVGAGERV